MLSIRPAFAVVAVPSVGGSLAIVADYTTTAEKLPTQTGHVSVLVKNLLKFLSKRNYARFFHKKLFGRSLPSWLTDDLLGGESHCKQLQIKPNTNRMILNKFLVFLHTVQQ